MFCPQCGADVRTSDDEPAGDTAGSEWESGGEQDSAEWTAGASTDADDDFVWGDTSETEEPGGGVSGSPGDEEAGVADSEDDSADSDDDQPFPEPTRLSRPPDSKHPEPMMGTEGDVVGHRIGAFFVDRILLIVLFFVPFLPGEAAESALGQEVAGWLYLFGLLVAFVVVIVYTLLLEAMYGQTPGKRLFGIVVVRENGDPCTVGASVLRSLVWVVDRFFWGLIGLALILSTDRSQRLGDLAADTVVVRTA